MTNAGTPPTLPTHGRFAYSAIRGRPAYAWPGGQRLAFYVALNLEHFAFGEGEGAALVPGSAQRQPDVLNWSWREWGNRVGAWRLLDVFDALAMPVTLLVNSALYAHCPELVAAFRARGDEIAGHGRTNSERQGALGEAHERALIRESAAAIARAEGAPPRGWLGPWISESRATPDLLAEEGFSYVLDWCMDDQPVWMQVRGGWRLLAVPYPQELNDIPAIIDRKVEGRAFADMIVDAFEEMLAQAEAGTPLVMGVALHPYIVGQPHRLRPLRRALEHVAARRDRVWMATAGAISDHVYALPPGVVPGG
jgi:peptidoglycan/xylan/chitin deacetylase (PgdA/CDA1 family)